MVSLNATNFKTITQKACAKKHCMKAVYTYQKPPKDFPYKIGYIQYIKESKKLFFKMFNPKEYVKEIEDENYYADNNVSIYQATPISYTLQDIYDEYTGGAHGDMGVAYINLNPVNNKPITLDDIISNKEAFKKIAFKEYKKQRHLKENESLIKDGWEENKFKLPPSYYSFAIKKDGLLLDFSELLYDKSREPIIKIPYSKIYNTLNQNFFTPLFGNKNRTYHFSSSELGLNIDVHFKKQSNKVLANFNFTFAKPYYKAYYSISLPQFFKKEEVKANDGKIYQKGDLIYNKQLHKNMKARYLLVEGPINKEKKTSLTLILPLKKYIVINLRVAMKKTKKAKMQFFPKEGNFEDMENLAQDASYLHDQQDFAVYELFYFKNPKKLFKRGFQ